MNGSIPTKPGQRGLAVAALGLLVAAAATSSASGAAPPRHPRLTPKFSAPVAFDVSRLERHGLAGAPPEAPVFVLGRSHRDPAGAGCRRGEGPGVFRRRSASGGQRVVEPGPGDPVPDPELRGPVQPGQLRRVRVPRGPAGSGWRRRPESLRRDDQPGLRRLRQERDLLLGPVDTGTLWAGFAVPTAPTPRAIPSSSTTSSWTGGSCRNLRPAVSSIRRAPSELRRDLQTGDPTGTYFRYAIETETSISPTTRSTECGRTRM